jgi:hypothetical protein
MRRDAGEKKDHMLWSIVAVLVTLWLLGLMTDYTMSSFIHVLFAAAIVLLLISINQEFGVYRELKETLWARRYEKSKL